MDQNQENPSDTQHKNVSFFTFVTSHLELPQSKVKKLGQDLLALDRLLDEFETCVGQQKEQLKDIKVNL